MHPMRAQLRKEIINHIRQQPNKLHLTLTFREGIYERSAEQLLKKLLWETMGRLNRYFYKANKFLTGVVAKEFQANGTVHFHAIIADPHGLIQTIKQFQEIVKFRLSRYTLGAKSKIAITDPRKGVSVQEYYDTGDSRLEKYITKVFEDHRFSTQQASDCIGYIGNGNVVFGDYISI